MVSAIKFDKVNSTNTIRVLFVTGSYPPKICGVGDYTSALVKEISKKDGMRVGVLTSNDAVQARVEGDGDSELLPVAQKWRFSELPKIISAIRLWRPNVVHIQYPTLGYGNSWMPYFLPLLLKIFGLRVVQTWHEPPTRFRFFPNALTKDTLIGVEPDYLQQIRRRYGWFVRRKETHYIPVGSNIPRTELTELERASIRKRYVEPGRNMVANFGFVYPTKRVEALFEIADHKQDTIVLITSLDPKKDSYHQKIMEYINKGNWAGKVVITGFLSADDVARLLCAADATVFPFQDGVGMRNASFLAARSQGTFTLTTSRDKRGYDAKSNVFYARPGDNMEMRRALAQYKGKRAERDCRGGIDWEKIANQHISLYRNVASGDSDSE